MYSTAADPWGKQGGEDTAGSSAPIERKRIVNAGSAGLSLPSPSLVRMVKADRDRGYLSAP
jgi:hypothetical protein